MVTTSRERSRGTAPSIKLRALAATGLFLVCLAAAGTLASGNLWRGFERSSPGDDVPYLGITYVSLSHDIAVRYSVGIESGLLVTEVSSGSPAATAGMRRGDVIVSADDEPVSGTSTLISILGRKVPGDRTAFRIQRGNQIFTAELLLSTRGRP